MRKIQSSDKGEHTTRSCESKGCRSRAEFTVSASWSPRCSYVYWLCPEHACDALKRFRLLKFEGLYAHELQATWITSLPGDRKTASVVHAEHKE